MGEQCCGNDNHKHEHKDDGSCCGSETTNPVLVNVTRGGVVESSHRGRICVVDTQGNVRLAMGDVEKPIYGRSAVKILQALPMVLSGGVEKYDLSAEEISVTCASHGGEERHTKVVESMLKKAGLSVDDLECGAHAPTHKDSAKKLIEDGKDFTPLHNNCSGKHAGMLILAKMRGFDTKGYINPDHPVQQSIMGMMESICECSLENAPMDRDGCSVPTWAIPMTNLAFAFAKISDPDSTLPETTATAVKKLRDSVIQEPFMVGGTNRACTRIMEVLKNKAFVKYGAEAVYTASLPEYGLGIAIKIDDGGVRAVEVAMLRILEEIGVLNENDKKELEKFYKQPITNWNGFTVGNTEPAF
ncbi:MAG: asparaginase [Alphaproteobacteria bacterium]